MFMETISIVEEIEQNADILYGERADEIRAAINEYLDDFIRNTARSGERHPESLIYDTRRERFQHAGLYGAQLNVKERHVTEANAELRDSLGQRSLNLFRRPFKKWVDRINNFLASVVPATGLGEALKELKDCLRDELPDDEDG
jgi:hypothetical protein